MRILYASCGLTGHSALRVQRVAHVVAMRKFGNSPARVRPVEAPTASSLRQSDNEVSASVVIAFMIVVPVWLLIIIGADKAEARRAAIKLNMLDRRKGL